MDRMQTPRTVAVDVFSVVHFVIHKIVSNYLSACKSNESKTIGQAKVLVYELSVKYSNVRVASCKSTPA